MDESQVTKEKDGGDRKREKRVGGGTGLILRWTAEWIMAADKINEWRKTARQRPNQNTYRMINVSLRRVESSPACDVLLNKTNNVFYN